MQLDVIADAICPWCYIGHKQLDRALRQRPFAGLTLRWRPFMLDPSIPPEGIDRKTYNGSRFGSDEMLSRGTPQAIAIGAKEGIQFAFEKIARIPNTLDAHRLVRWAQEEGKAGAVMGRLHQAYFEAGIDIGDRTQLARIARAAGLDDEAVAEKLDSETDVTVIIEEDQAVRSLGINGVPCILVDGKYALMGAQEPANLIAVIERILAHDAP